MATYLHSILSCLFFLLCQFHITAQEFVYKKYNLPNGLENSTVHSIYQDKEGFLWIGTESGLFRYDGTNFKLYTVKDGLPGNDVFGIFEDSKARLWLKLYKNSLAYIYKGKIYNAANDSLVKKIKPVTRIYGIVEDTSGNLVFCDSYNIYILPADGGPVTNIHPREDKQFNIVNAYADSNHQVVISTNRALCTIENLQLKKIKQLIAPNFVFGQNDILLHPKYIALGADIMCTVYLKDTVLHINLPAYTVKKSALSDSMLAFNTLDGACLLNIKNYNIVKVLPHEKVTNTLIDKEDNLWIGTSGKGLYKVGSREILNKRFPNNRNEIYYISKEENKIIAANINTELFEIGNNSMTQRPFPALVPLMTYRVFYYEKLATGTHLMGHGMGLLKIKNDKVEKELVSHVVKQVSNDDPGTVLIAANAGIIRVRKDDLKPLDTLWPKKTLSFLRRNDTIWAGTLSGLYILKKDQEHFVPIDSLLFDSIIGRIYETEDHSVWVSTFENGLYCLHNKTVVHHLTEGNGLPDNNCRCVYVDHNDIWLGTDQGLARILNHKDSFRIRKYSTSDGLPSNIINSIYKDGAIVYVGTPEGLCSFNERLIETSSICNLVLTNVRIGEKDVDFRDHYDLDKRQRLIVEFSGISFRSEQEIQYRYRIAEIDDTWQTTRSNSLEFTSLPFGEYELEIVAINKQGIESRHLLIPIHVKRPFYNTTWFLLLAILIPVFIIVFFYIRRINELRRKQLQKLQQEIKMLELEQMALRLQMNPHFIFNCINTIQQLVTDNDTANTHKFITSFSQLVRQTLDNAPELFIALDEEIKFLKNYLELERIKLEDRFSYTIRTTNIKNTQQWVVPNMIIQPYAENAIHHGIRYKKNGKGHVDILFEENGSSLRCIISDNGIGRERAQQIKEELGIKHNSKAMGIISKRIESLNSFAEGKILLDIEDLQDAKQEAAGTRVILDFYKIKTYDSRSNS